VNFSGGLCAALVAFLGVVAAAAAVVMVVMLLLIVKVLPSVVVEMVVVQLLQRFNFAAADPDRALKLGRIIMSEVDVDHRCHRHRDHDYCMPCCGRHVSTQFVLNSLVIAATAAANKGEAAAL
jgi:hypothetical protein